MDANDESASLRIQLLGRFHVSVDEEDVDGSRWQRRGAMNLVKILALEPHNQLHREQLMERLWPDSAAHAAANSLSKVIHAARRALEPGLRKGTDSRFLRRQSDVIVLCSPGELSIDVTRFEARAAEAIERDTIEAYETSRNLYSGDLLEEDLYEDWLLDKRDELRLLYQQLTARLAQRYADHGRIEDSISGWSELLRVDPDNEDAHRQLMQLYMQTGHRQQALLQYDRCCEAIKGELGMVLEEATTRLHEEILSGRYQRQGFAQTGAQPNTETEIDSIAVLPFENASGDSQLAYLCDGVTDSLINGLARLPGLRVMARSTVFRYRDRDIDPQAVGRRLNVRCIIVGRVAQWTERLVVATELIRVSDGSLLWGEQFNRPSADIFAIQEEISQNISRMLRLKLTRTEISRVGKRFTDSTEAYQHYLKGRFHWNRRTGAGLTKALSSFNRALEVDRQYALAYAGLADCYNVMSLYNVAPPGEAMPKAKKAAADALTMDATLAEAHTALAYCKLMYDWDWRGAEQAFQRAIELNPNYATAYHWYHVCLTALGKFEAGAAQLESAKNLDPLSLIIDTEQGWGLYLARRYDPAARHLERTLDMEPHFAIAHLVLGMTYLQEQRYELAVTRIKKAIELQEEAPFALAIGTLGHAYARCGESTLAQSSLEELGKLSESFYVSAYTRALIHAGLEDFDTAFSCLETAFEERYDRLIFLNVEPMFDALRPRPRFARLIHRLGLS